MEKELKVGETFYDGNDKLEVVKQGNYEGCYYEDENCSSVPYGCYLSCRKDHKSVIFKQINDMETKEISIEIPEGMEIDKEKSDIEKGKIAFKKKEQEVKTWNDLIRNKNIPNKCFYIDDGSEIPELRYTGKFRLSDKNVFIDEKHAKAALAMAMISQLMPYYGGKISDEEWRDKSIPKYCIDRDSKEDLVITKCVRYEFLAFHTEYQANRFLGRNRELCKQFKLLSR